jgi:starch-binding outer membrane protein, SusD/RagB family
MTNTNEDIFAIQQSTISNAGTSNSGLATHYACLYGQGRGDIIINNQHLARYEEGDLRGSVQIVVKDKATFLNIDTMFYIGIGIDNSGHTNIVKWGDATKNIPVVRLAEMYLTRAEGNFEAGTAHGALPIDDVNLIRERAGLTDLTVLTEDDIRNERRLELAYEGFALHDIRRWHLNIGTLTYDDPRLILPIPQREIDVNPELEQNEWYKTQ